MILSFSKLQKAILSLGLCASISSAQQNTSGGEVLQRQKWTAQWIAHPTAPLREPRVFHFRKTINLPAKPTHFIVHVSADNRFLLYVNGRRVGEGPARGDLTHWRYETFDLEQDLQKGANVIAATVWQFGIFAPIAQITDRAALLVQGDTDAEVMVNSDKTWQVEEESGHDVIRREAKGFYLYWGAGSGERIDGAKYDW